MNNLSWLIFAADVIPSVASALCVATFVLFIPVAIMYVAGITNGFGDAKDDNPVMERFRKLGPAIIILPVLWLSTFLVPDDKETYYAIAASEVGEEILKTPEVGKARKAVNNWLDEQLKEDEEPEQAEGNK